jgi:4-amino-4-deoxy-L-arabinose transferase-like glycosyltransferase
LGQGNGSRPEESLGAIPEAAWGALIPIAAAGVAVLLLVGGRHGYHRDELYFLEASRHLAWGYVDEPPLSIVFVRLSRPLFGDMSLLGLRVLPALAFGSAVLLTGLVARELGGRRFPQALSALALAASPFLIAGHLAGPTVFDLVAWTVVSLLVIRIVRTGREQLWVLCGVVVGVGLLNKETMLFLVAGLVVGFLLNRQTSIFRNPWMWTGAGIALAIWSPTLVWQSHHGWAMLEMSQNIRREHSGLGDSLSFVAIQLLLPGWWTAPIWMAGWWALWRERRFSAPTARSPSPTDFSSS